ncbi:MAG TPA: FeoA family protein [Steroidobacteraceae bacterium]
MAVVASQNPAPVSLANLRKGASGVVSAVLEADSEESGEIAGAAIRRRLAEVGFVAGETVEVIETVWPGGDPMAVRIGSSVFALRRREALAVMVQLAPT